MSTALLYLVTEQTASLYATSTITSQPCFIPTHLQISRVKLPSKLQKSVYTLTFDFVRCRLGSLKRLPGQIAEN